MTWRRGNTGSLSKSARTWAQAAADYREKNDILVSQADYYVTPCANFYGLLFGDGNLERSSDGRYANHGDGDGGKPNGIAVMIRDGGKYRGSTGLSPFDDDEPCEPVSVELERRYVKSKVTFHDDDMDKLSSVAEFSRNTGAAYVIAPNGYFGKDWHLSNARAAFGVVVDVDGVTPEKLRNIVRLVSLSHKERGTRRIIPQPSAIVNSGTGVHLYYFLDKPIKLRRYETRERKLLSRVKDLLYEYIWNEDTSVYDPRDYERHPLSQGYRIVDSATKITQNVADEPYGEHRQHECVAYCYQPGGRQWRVSMEDLVDGVYLMGASSDEMRELRSLTGPEPEPATGAPTRRQMAMLRYPNWDPDKVRREGAGKWHVSRSMYDWWLREITLKARIHHRYYCVQSLAAVAKKCDVSFEELRRDAYALIEPYNDLVGDLYDPFTRSDVDKALLVYGDKRAHLWRIDYIERDTGIEIKRRKRNGRTRAEHMSRLAELTHRRDELGIPWRHAGRESVADEIRTYAIGHPNASVRDVCEATGRSDSAVRRHTQSGWEDEWGQLHQTDAERAIYGAYRASVGHLYGMSLSARVREMRKGDGDGVAKRTRTRKPNVSKVRERLSASSPDADLSWLDDVTDYESLVCGYASECGERRVTWVSEVLGVSHNTVSKWLTDEGIGRWERRRRGDESGDGGDAPHTIG